MKIPVKTTTLDDHAGILCDYITETTLEEELHACEVILGKDAWNTQVLQRAINMLHGDDDAV